MHAGAAARDGISTISKRGWGRDGGGAKRPATYERRRGGDSGGRRERDDPLRCSPRGRPIAEARDRERIAAGGMVARGGAP